MSEELAESLHRASNIDKEKSLLIRIAMKFQKLYSDILLFNYARSEVFSRNPTLQLATDVVNRSDLMSEDTATKGLTFHIESGDILNALDTTYHAHNAVSIIDLSQ